jgi:Ca2+-binding RTX toxin-like protein
MAVITGTTGNDTLVGGTGNDSLIGYTGNDTYQYALGNGQDTVTDTGGTDTLFISDLNNSYVGHDIYRSGTDLVFDFLSAGKVTILNQFSTTVSGRIEFLTADVDWGPFTIQDGLTGTTGNDMIVGTGASDTISGGLGDDSLWGGAGNDSINGGDGENEMHGGAGNDTLIGGIDDDMFYGGPGSDIIVGGAGDDEALYSELPAGIFVNLSGYTQLYDNRLIATNRVFETGGNTVDTLSSIEEVIGTAYGDYFALGRTDSHTEIESSKGNDIVDGGGTNCSVSLDYNDDPSGVIINLSQAAITVTLGTETYNVGRGTARDGWGDTDTFILYNANLSFSGSDYADYFRGRDSASDWFDGGKGNDTLDGGTGNDGVWYGDDDAPYGVIVNLSSASVTVNSISVAAGTARDNWGDIDTLKNIENVNGGPLADYILGSTENNYLRGEDGNDTLNGGSGADMMLGGGGNDIYYVDNTGDGVYETTAFDNAIDAGGVDFVYSYLNAYTLGSYVENGRILSTGAANLTGNSLNNTLYAGAGNNVINGGAGTDAVSYAYAGSAVTVSLALTTAQATGGSGADTLNGIENLIGSNYNDTLTGNSANNTLNGGNGNDTLNGGVGNDTMVGGTGNDMYYIDSAGDVVSEGSSAGTDRVNAYVSDILDTNVENLYLYSSATNGTGNSLNNIIAGNSNANTLSGLDGNDSLYGYGGNDSLIGGNGNDYMVGGAGNDTLNGGAGQDRFVFAESGSVNRDTISSFSHTDDTIVLRDILDGSANSAITGLSFTSNVLNAGSYVEGAGKTGGGAIDASGIYNNTTTGEIWYNPTSSVAGDSVVICTVGSTAAASLDNTDFVYSA